MLSVYSDQGCTIEQLAEMTNVSVRTVRSKRQALKRFVVDQIPTGARPKYLYSPQAASMFKPGDMEDKVDKVQDCTSTPRADKGKPRGKNLALLDTMTKMAFSEVMSSGMYDVRAAARRAVKRARNLIANGSLEHPIEDLEKIVDKDWFYRKWLIRRDSVNCGVSHKENWKIKWELQYKQWSQATSTVHVRYNHWKIAESDYGCGKGRGFARMIFCDDRQTDVYLNMPDGAQMRYAVYVWDLLTGCLLWVEPTENVNAQTYIKAILATVTLHGFDAPVFFMENARAAMAARVQHLIEGLYSAEDYNELLSNNEHRKMFLGEVLVHRNVPNIPRDFGKGAGERFFGEIKKLDAQRYPRAFQGGNRAEAVELQRSKKIIPAKKDMADEQAYYRGLLHDCYDDYLDMHRDSLKPWAREKGLEPTRRAMIEYYKPAKKKMVRKVGYIKAMFFANPNLPVATVRNLGFIRCQIQGRQLNLVSSVLFENALLGQKVAIVPTPFDDKEFGLFKLGTEPEYLGIAYDQTAETLEEGNASRKENRKIREELIAKHKKETAELLADLPPELQPDGLIAERQSQIELPTLPLSEGTLEAPEFVEAIEVSSDDELQGNVVQAIDVETAAHEDEDDEDVDKDYNKLMGYENESDDEDSDLDDLYEELVQA